MQTTDTVASVNRYACSWYASRRIQKMIFTTTGVIIHSVSENRSNFFSYHNHISQNIVLKCFRTFMTVSVIVLRQQAVRVKQQKGCKQYKSSADELTH